MSVVLASMPWMVGDNGNRKHPDLFAMETNAMYTEWDTTEETWARFEIKLEIATFDDWKIFLIENENIARIITEYNGSIKEYQLVYGEFDAAIQSAYDGFNKLYEEEKRRLRL